MKAKTSTAKKAVKKTAKKPKKDIAASYNRFKVFGGRQYTGMQVGRSHYWYYDQGDWIETKLDPDKWKIHFAVTKRRKGKAPEGSGVPVGTEYHWYILADQYATKLDANSYATSMTGLKFKIAHKRADHDDWNISEKTQRKHLIRILQDFIAQLEKEMEEPGKPEEELLSPPAETQPAETGKKTLRKRTATVRTRPAAQRMKAVPARRTRTTQKSERS